ncbi:MAG: protocatechuate 3,4-dioxygenase subunit alpha [Gemmatimonadota bacterium]|nr:protocatechuate 3,4-dioxygenase subunit alpha [Gemmatimonadota bacterium]
MTVAPLTTSQTVGPFFHDCLMRADVRCEALAMAGAEGQRIRVDGHVNDGEGKGVPDAVIELWQANHYGRYNHPADSRPLPLDPSFRGFGRIATDEAGRFSFTTIKPGPVPSAADQTQAPHIVAAIFARGLLNHLLTRIYFEDDPAITADPVLLLVPPERRATLLARRDLGHPEPRGEVTYHFEIVLQGDGETVFFNIP